jgi:hypothetical protein
MDSTRAQQFRENAKECEALAEAITDPVNKGYMLEVAQRWLELAKTVELIEPP